MLRDPPTEAEIALKDELIAIADDLCVRQVELAKMAGVSQMTVSRWKRGDYRMPIQCVEAIRAGLEAAARGPASPPGAAAVRHRAAPADERPAMDRFLELAGPDPGGAEPLKVAAQRHRLAMLGVLVDLALHDRSGAVRRQAASEVLQRSDGRAALASESQESHDDGINDRLLELLARAKAESLCRQIAKATTADDLEDIEDSRRTLPEHHKQGVLDAIEARRKELGLSSAVDAEELPGDPPA